MKIFKKLKLESLKKKIFIVIALLAFGGYVFGTAVKDIAARYTPISYEELDLSNLDNNEEKYLHDIVILLMPYADHTKSYNGISVAEAGGSYYLAILDEYNLVSVYVKNSDIEEADSICDNNVDALYSEDGSIEFMPWEVNGEIRSVSSLKSLYDYYKDSEMLSIADNLDMKLLNMNIGSSSFQFSIYVIFVIGAGMLIYAFVIIIKVASGRYQKQIKSTLAELGEMSAERFEEFYDTEKGINGMKLNSEFLYFNQAAESVLLKPSDIVWIYKENTTTRKGVTIYSIIFAMTDGSKHQMSKGRSKIDECYGQLQEKLPNIQFGYSDGLQNLYMASPAEFLSKLNEIRNAENNNEKAQYETGKYEFPCDKR